MPKRYVTVTPASPGHPWTRNNVGAATTLKNPPDLNLHWIGGSFPDEVIPAKSHGVAVPAGTATYDQTLFYWLVVTYRGSVAAGHPLLLVTGDQEDNMDAVLTAYLSTTPDWAIVARSLWDGVYMWIQ